MGKFLVIAPPDLLTVTADVYPPHHHADTRYPTQAISPDRRCANEPPPPPTIVVTPGAVYRGEGLNACPHCGILVKVSNYGDKDHVLSPGQSIAVTDRALPDPNDEPTRGRQLIAD